LWIYFVQLRIARPISACANRGKKSVTLNLASAPGQAARARRCASDVRRCCSRTTSSATSARYGLGYEDLTGHQPAR
jgi:crotonobetainyl-CoA:carnitine CoA-transferase CaiB-like acyl-CoA transferase